MNKILIFILGLLIFVSPVFADGNLTVVVEQSNLAPVYANTNTTVDVLNLTLNASSAPEDSQVNITSINFTITGVTNISGIEVYNNTGTLLGASTNPADDENFTVAFADGYYFNDTTNASIFVKVNISESGTSGTNFTVNITTESIGTNESTDNVSFTQGTSLQTEGTQIQDIHATASVTPRYVDTGVENQTFSYIITPTGSDNITNISITMPTGYELVQIAWIRHGTEILRNTTWTNTNKINITTGTNNFDIVNFTSYGFGEIVTINYTVNTSLTALAAMQFNSTIDGGNFSDVSTYVGNDETNVTTVQELAKIESMAITKGTAVVNGTDYWEINYSINITNDISGLIHFRMSEWNATVDGTPRSINLTDNETFIDTPPHTTFYATFRNETNFATSNKINVWYFFNMSAGVRASYNNDLQTFIMRMVVPTGTPIARAWTSTAGILFRSDA